MKPSLFLGLGILLAATFTPPAAAAPPRPVGSEIAVNVATLGSHVWPVTDLFSDGGFVLAWTDIGQKSSVHARFFSAAGTPVSGEIRLLAPSDSNTQVTSVVVDRDDSFLVAWMDTPPGKPTRVLVERFNRTGKALGPAFQVHAGSPQPRFGGRLALCPGGGFAVAWTAAEDHLTHTEEGADVHAADVYARVYTAGGVPLSPEFRANESTFDDQFLAGLAVSPNGVLNVLYTSWEELYALRMRRLTPRGRPLGAEVAVSSEDPNGAAGLAALSQAPDGTFTVAWSAYGLADAVTARRFAADGSPLTDDFGVELRGQGQDVVGDLASLPDGGFVAVWTNQEARDGEGEGIFGRAFGPSGLPLTRDFQLNETTPGNQHDPVVAGRNGRFVVAWNQTALNTVRPSKVRARLLGSR
ncbi:MAG TPA: hypothetical protein VFE33_15390 [Thermoanaerobaculia bacterium]|nr:hypothetical protein [Thermoanaerobaculia bacterium]